MGWAPGVRGGGRTCQKSSLIHHSLHAQTMQQMGGSPVPTLQVSLPLHPSPKIWHAQGGGSTNELGLLP